MKVLIIEDESLSAQMLERALKALRPDWEIIGRTTSIEASLRFFSEHKDLDVVFADIRLDDGLSFAIFDRVETSAAVVFVTGFDEYALRAFEYNCADYLMKPVQNKALERALCNCEMYSMRLTSAMLKDMSRDILHHNVKYRKRLMLEHGISALVIPVEAISYITAETGGTKVFLRDGTSGYVSSSLSQLENELAPSLFARVNRQFIVALDAIKAFNDVPSKRECALEIKAPYENVDVRISIPKRKELYEKLY